MPEDPPGAAAGRARSGAAGSLRIGPADVGRRVSLRRVLDPAAPAGSGRRWTDLLGELLAWDDDGVVVRTDDGEVRVPPHDVVAGRTVPPRPARRPER